MDPLLFVIGDGQCTPHARPRSDLIAHDERQYPFSRHPFEHVRHPKSHVTSCRQGRTPHRAGLRIIAIYEVAKTICLLLVAGAAFHLDHQKNFEQLVRWLENLPLTGSDALRWKLVHALQTAGHVHFGAIGFVALGYALLFGVEGVGLLMGKYWAEWFTVIATASLVPLELYETWQHFGWIKLLALLGNVVIVVYLVRVALQSQAQRRNLAT